uniref:Heat shock protein beta-1-like n=1 Tax=Saccoglossus kowalevskii TaxID=10224 RepID=A0ABM0MBB5_SACKO
TPNLASGKTPFKRTETRKTDSSEQSLVEPKAKNFRLAVDVGNVSPDDLSVKISDGVLKVNGKSTEADTDGNVYSVYTFTHEFMLPKNVNVDSLTSKLKEDGVLMFEAPLLATKEPTEIYLPITVDKTNELNEEPESKTELPQSEESLKCEAGN